MSETSHFFSNNFVTQINVDPEDTVALFNVNIEICICIDPEKEESNIGFTGFTLGCISS